MCSPRRSQHRNKAKALELLARRVGGALAQRRAAEESEQRLSLRGSGDRSERIRTYNAPHDRVTGPCGNQISNAYAIDATSSP